MQSMFLMAMSSHQLDGLVNKFAVNVTGHTFGYLSSQIWACRNKLGRGKITMTYKILQLHTE